MGVVFEIILSTYNEYVSTLNWICTDENMISSNDYPSKIFVKVTEGNAITHKINVGYIKDNSYQLISQTSDNVNSGYYNSLGKVYDVNTKDGLNSLKSDCKQFAGLTDEKIISLISNNTKECSTTQTTPSNLPNQSVKPNNNSRYTPEIVMNDSNNNSTNSTPSVGRVDRSNLVTNPKMKLVLSDVGHLNSASLGQNYTLPYNKYKGKCTSGPSTWYQRSGMKINADLWWNGNLKNGSKCNFQNTKSYLLSLGFVPVWHGTLDDLDKLTSSFLYPGDVSTMYTGINGHAHGLMWDGVNWRSDCVQSHANCYGKYKNEESLKKLGNYAAIIWRHPDYQEPNHPMLPSIV